MPADVFAQDLQGTRRVEKGGGVQSASALENVLRGTQQVRKLYKKFRRAPKIRVRRFEQPRADEVDRGFAANTATRRCEKVPLHLREVWNGFGNKFCLD